MSAPNPPYATEIRAFDGDAVALAAALIARGLPVAVPTETVYGLAADATDGAAVARIYQAKGRPDFNPLIVHVADLAEAEHYGRFGQAARAVAEAFWPGAVTLVVPLREGGGIARIATAGLDTIALRSPAHPAIRALLAASGRPLAAPSANASGGISPTRAEHVARSLDGRISLVIDGGPTELGLESTIVGLREDGISLLRPGPVGFEAIVAASGLAPTAAAQRIQAPGQLASHYAPGKPVRLEAGSRETGEWLIGFGPVTGDESLSESGDLVEAAARLFDALHRADASPPPRIAIAPIPEAGLGVAINDRLRRAAAPR